MSAFTHAWGKTQFSNMGFVFKPIVGATVPYAALGTGFVFHHEDGPLVMVSVLKSTDTTSTSVFDTLTTSGLLLSAAVQVAQTCSRSRATSCSAARGTAVPPRRSRRPTYLSGCGHADDPTSHTWRK